MKLGHTKCPHYQGKDQHTVATIGTPASVVPVP